MRSWAIIACLFALCSTSAIAEESPLTAEDKALLAWFDSLGLPSVEGLEFVEVTVRGDERLVGFLMETQDGYRVVRRTDLWRVHWFKTPVPKDIRETARELIDVLEGKGEHRNWFLRAVPTRLTAGPEALVIARECAARGHEAIAHDLLEAARSSSEKALRAHASREFAHTQFWQLVLDFEDPRLKRDSLLERLRRLHKTFPNSEHHDRMGSTVTILTRMVREDTEHVVLSERDIAKLTPEAQARELVFRLRDHNVSDYPDAADGLERLGVAAVPALIEAITDERFTRSVHCWRHYCFSHEVERVGDTALHILNVLGVRPQPFPKRLRRRRERPRQVQTLYREAWEKEVAFLDPLIALATAAVTEHKAIVDRVPDRAPGRIAGFSWETVWGTGSVIEVFGGALDPGRTALKAVVQHSPHVGNRVLAAWALLDLGDASGVQVIADIWKGLSVEDKLEPSRGEHVAAFLAACGHASAVHVLRAGLDNEPATVRELVLHAFSNQGLGNVRGLSCNKAGIREPWRLDGDAAEAAKRLIAGRLDDIVVGPLLRIPMRPGWGHAGNRIADLAARVLATRWTDEYRFEDDVLPATDEEWERARRAFRAQWQETRSRQGR